MTTTHPLDALILALLRTRDLTVSELALALGRQLPQADRDAGRTVYHGAVSKALARLEAAGRVASRMDERQSGPWNATTRARVWGVTTPGSKQRKARTAGR